MDETFGRFSLGDPESYCAFLTAHARIVPAVEAWLDAHQPDDMRPWSLVRRTPGLMADLAELGVEVPENMTFDLAPDMGAICGVTYVMEGSRLGGAFLSRAVAADLPRAYLGAPSQNVLWRDFLNGLDMHLSAPAKIERACQAALETFAQFKSAAAPVAA